MVLLCLAGAGLTNLNAASGEPAPGLAFARHIALAPTPDPFAQSAIVQIEAALPGLYKECSLLGLRRTTAPGRNEYLWLDISGDPLVAQELIATYLALQEHLASLPRSSVAITPANYRFRYVGPVGAGPESAYVFRVRPRRKADGMIDGELWIDAASGETILQSGELVKTLPTFAAPVHFVRDTKLLDGVPTVRVTHLTLATKAAGHGELVITEARPEALQELQLGSPDALVSQR